MVPKPIRPEFEFHYVRRTLDEGQRRQAVRQGWGDFQFFGWQKDPPFGMADPRRWLWQNGAEGAEQHYLKGTGTLVDVVGYA